jgi:hypothetical protein
LHRLRAGLVLLALVVACSRSRAVAPVPDVAPAPPTSATLWPDILAGARAAADSGRYSTADSTLRRFAEEFVGTPESAESMYWRALLTLDPVNPASSPAAALAALDAYLAGGPANLRYAEATVLRRTVGLLDSLRIAAAPKPPAPVPRDTLLEQEAERLRTELATAKAELERIRRLLARPRP